MVSGEEKERIEGFSKRAKSSFSQGSRWSSNQSQMCKDGGRSHAGACKKMEITCFKCGQLGHY